jgi:hypothetical protein
MNAPDLSIGAGGNELQLTGTVDALAEGMAREV